MKQSALLFSLSFALFGQLFGADSAPQMLAPGFVVRELPVKLTSLNNIEYAPDGRLFAAGYDGRFHLLRDTDGDGLEDKVDTFWPETSANYALGMVVNVGLFYGAAARSMPRCSCRGAARTWAVFINRGLALFFFLSPAPKRDKGPSRLRGAGLQRGAGLAQRACCEV
jgi:hypothetical protein